MLTNEKSKEELIRELDALRQRTAMLEENLAHQERIEQENRRLLYDLKERIKELNCLLGISSLLTEPDCSLEKIFYRILGIIPGSWQYPEVTCACIVFAGQEYTSPDFKVTAWKQSAPIITANRDQGILEVYYREEKPQSEEGPFLKEERHLLDALAVELGIIIEYKKAANELFNYQKQLRYLASELSLSEERERQRISAILHDCIGQNLFISKVKLDVLKSMMPSINLAETINEISMLMEHTIQTSRSLTYTLASPDLYSLGLKAAVQQIADKALDRELTQVELTGDEAGIVLQDEIRIFLYQAIRELLHNISKHAAAGLVKIHFRKKMENLVFVIRDDGRGCTGDPFTGEGSSGFGLLNIRERCRHLEGSLVVESGSRKGTEATLTLPVKAQHETGAAKNTNISILLADDHKIVLDTLRNSLENEPGFKVVAVAESGRIAVELALELKPDVVVIDISMPDLNGIEATRRIVTKNQDIKVIALTIHADKQMVSRMLSAGARGYLLKDYNLEELIHAIRTVASNNTYLCPGITNIVTSEYLNFLTTRTSAAQDLQHTPSLLSPREHEILQLFAEGKTTKQIASGLHLSINTIDTHKWKIMKKLDIETFAGLVKYAIRSGITTMES